MRLTVDDVELDLVVTTAQIPGRPAPKLITDAMVADMRPGSVIVDLAAESGGNCTLTRAGETVDSHGVLVYGAVDIPSTVPTHASQMFGRNVLTLVRENNDKESSIIWVLTNTTLTDLFDRVLIFDKGRLVGDGKHAELADNATFRELVS